MAEHNWNSNDPNASPPPGHGAGGANDPNAGHAPNPADPNAPQQPGQLQPSAQPRQSMQRSAPAQFCEYCGAQLNAFFYFCTACGSPYKQMTSVISPDIPRQLTEGELIRVKAPNVWPLFWTYVAVLLFAGIIGHLLYVNDEPNWAVALQYGSLFITTCVFGAMYWPTLQAQLGVIGFNRAAAWIALAILIPTLGVNWLWSSMWIELLESSGETYVDPMQELEGEWSMGALILGVCVFPAIIEEVAFRGLLQHWLMTALRPWRAIVIASFLFAALHFSVPGLPYLFGVGVLLGWAKWKTGSLYPSILIHFLHNLGVVLYL